MLIVNCLKKDYLTNTFTALIVTFILVFLNSCATEPEEKITFFGGKIKNPKDDYVYIFQNGKVLDSAKLDSHHKFSFPLDSIDVGLYIFRHGPEFQYLYLEPQDSLMIYLNTWDFDESLIFSGKGSKKNNFLINLYLQQEQNEKNFKYNYKLGEEEFSEVVEEGIKKLLEQYNEFLSSEEEAPNPFFDKLIKAEIYFPFYYFKEYYPYNHKWQMGLKNFPELSDEFYSFRKDVDLNDASLLEFVPYTLYVKTYLYHLAHEEKSKDPEKKNIELNFMRQVVDKIHLEPMKNEFLAASAWRSLSNQYFSEEEHKEIQDYFLTHCSDERFRSELTASVEQMALLSPGDTLPELKVTDSSGNEVFINQYTKNNPSVIFFWPKDRMRAEMVKMRLHELQKDYPDVVFLGIERNLDQNDWNKFLESNKLSKDRQFQLSKSSDTYAWFAGDMERTILVDARGQILNPFLFFNDKYLDMHLKDLKKR